LPIEVPSSSPRIVSMIGVNGSCRANQRTAPDIESAFLAESPTATASQLRARVSSATTPAIASQSSGPAEGRKPSSSATANTSATLIIVRASALTT
jgi:hypothetical protein